MSVVFTKMTGSGNDFVVLDGRTSPESDWTPDRIARICDRRDGVGADGLVIVTPIGPDRVRMTYFNSDGSRAAMCGNAALCSTRLAARLEMADPARMTLVTDAGEYEARCVGAGSLAEIHFPDVSAPEVVGIPLAAGEQSVALGTVGVPHLVLRVGDVSAVPLEARGRELRFHPGAGPAGANANFVSRLPGSGGAPSEDPAAPSWAIRTYERGVEGETLACGTGTVAAALAIAASGEDRLPLRFRSASGRVLSVAAELAGRSATQIWLCGEGLVVFRGVWEG
jgi:diaminopimelate epimerase